MGQSQKRTIKRPPQDSVQSLVLRVRGNSAQRVVLACSVGDLFDRPFSHVPQAVFLDLPLARWKRQKP
jgi:hypothetical protein